MAVESLSGSWSAQVPERPAAVGSRLVYPRGCRGVDPCGPSRRIPRCRRIGRIDAPLRPFAWFPGAGGSAADRPLRTSLTLRPFASKSPAAAYTRRFVSTLRGRGSGRFIRPLGVYIRSLGLVSWPAWGAYAATADVYPFIGSGFVVLWGCMCPLWGCAYAHWRCISVHWRRISVHWGCISVHWVWFRGLLGVHFLPLWLYIRPLGVYIRSLGVVSWLLEGAFWSRHVRTKAFRQWPY